MHHATFQFVGSVSVQIVFDISKREDTFCSIVWYDTNSERSDEMCVQ